LIHFLLVQGFDINDFDERGHKSFASKKGTYEVGPPNKKKKYVQPHGWTRYGLKVLDGRYGNDHTWLDPFQHDNNWYRAFHGTNGKVGKQIITQGLIPGKRQAYKREVGCGVYCSPVPQDAETYATGQTITIQTADGQTKKYIFMFQLALNPDKVRFTSRESYWVVPDNQLDGIRIYGILLKEV